MLENVTIGPMSADSVLWRCLHSGPITTGSIDSWDMADGMPWAELRARNVPLLRKLADSYGAYAIVARDGDRIVGQTRFYPKAICALEGAGQMCLQQEYPAGPRAGGYPDLPGSLVSVWRASQARVLPRARWLGQVSMPFDSLRPRDSGAPTRRD